MYEERYYVNTYTAVQYRRFAKSARRIRVPRSIGCDTLEGYGLSNETL